MKRLLFIPGNGHSVASYSKDENPPADVEIREVEHPTICSSDEECLAVVARIKELVLYNKSVLGCSKKDREDSSLDEKKEIKSILNYLSIFKPVRKASSCISMGVTGTIAKEGGRKHKNKFNTFRNDANNLTPEQVIAERTERLEKLRSSHEDTHDKEFLKMFVNNTVNSYPNGNFDLFANHFAEQSSVTDLDRFIKSGAYDNVKAESVDVAGRDDIGMTLLHRAIKNGRHTLVERLIHLGFDINAKTDYLLTPLMIAAIGGHYQIVELLIEARADLHYTVITGMNALHYAALYRQIDVVIELIEAGMDPNLQDFKQETALHKAAMSYDNLLVVVFLVDSGADLLAVNFCQYTPLDLAISADHGSTGSLSICYSEDESPTRDVEMNEVEHVSGCSMEDESATADVEISEMESAPECSRDAIEDSFMEELKSKMDHYLRTFKQAPTACSSSIRLEVSGGSTPTDSSSRSSSEERDKKRTKRGGRKHKNKFKKFKDYAKNVTPEHVISERGERLQALKRSDGDDYDEEFLRIFIDNTVNSEPNGNFNLFVHHFSTPRMDTDLDRLIQSGAYDDLEAGSVDVNRRDDNGMTMLHRAIKNGRKPLVDRLIHIGFDINSKTDYLLTPLMIAAIGGYHQIVKLLIEARADILSRVHSGMNALHYAALYKHLDVVKLLIEAGMNPNLQDFKLESALHKAAMRGDNLEVVMYLIEVGADVQIVNYLDLRPLELAIRAEDDQTISHLTTITLFGSKYHSL